MKTTMKLMLMLLVVAGMATFTSCKKEKQENPEQENLAPNGIMTSTSICSIFLVMVTCVTILSLVSPSLATAQMLSVGLSLGAKPSRSPFTIGAPTSIAKAAN